MSAAGLDVMRTERSRREPTARSRSSLWLARDPRIAAAPAAAEVA
jgi:hypothetical protein